MKFRGEHEEDDADEKESKGGEGCGEWGRDCRLVKTLCSLEGSYAFKGFSGISKVH